MSAWDPKQAARDRAAKRAAENKAPPLNPPFPWRVVAFNPLAFGVAQDPPRPPQDRRDP